MSGKPSYLGLLNAIAVGERRAYSVLSAWRDATEDQDLARVLNVVAIREHEHAAAFAKRLCELGYGVRCSPSEEYDRSLELAKSSADDADKFRVILGYGDAGDAARADPLANVFDDQSIDPQTGALLGRFVAEERDSERLLRGAWQSVPGPSTQTEPAQIDEEEDHVLAEIVERIDRLARTLEELKELRR